MKDPYFYHDCPVLRNLLNIRDEAELDKAEAELSRARMMLLYNDGFSDFSEASLSKIHRYLFGDVYDWAGEYRKINVIKRERLLAGQSVWYSNCEDIERDLRRVWTRFRRSKWAGISKRQFVRKVSRLFPALWQIHPFREGNTRTVVMLLTFFVEAQGYYFDQDLMAQSAGYVRNAFVLASLGQNAEYQHLEKILMDAITTEPTMSQEEFGEADSTHERYEKYKTDYRPEKHEYYQE